MTAPVPSVPELQACPLHERALDALSAASPLAPAGVVWLYLPPVVWLAWMWLSVPA